MRYPGLLIFCSLLLCSSTERLNAVSSPAQDMTDAAANFLAALTPEEKTKASFEFKDEERFDWHFIPKSRKGLPIKDMTSPQRLLAHALLNSGLSQRGYLKATTIMSLEQILYNIKANPAKFQVIFLFRFSGTPGSGSWGWRVEGHHLSLNFTLNGAQVVAVTPSFFGANPARFDPARERVYASLEAKKISLANWLPHSIAISKKPPSSKPRRHLTSSPETKEK